MGVNDKASGATSFGNQFFECIRTDVNGAIANRADQVTVRAAHEVKDRGAAAQMGVLGETDRYQLVQDAVGR